MTHPIRSLMQLCEMNELSEACQQGCTANYTRVIPRDLFNEASLLKCYGKLWLNLESWPGNDVVLTHTGENRPFDIRQNQGSGGLCIANVTLMVRGQACYLERPLNSREAWPLYLITDETEIDVFDAGGNLSKEMVAFLRGTEEPDESTPPSTPPRSVS